MLLSFISSYSSFISIFIMFATFVLTAIAYYLLAKKRNISKPWIAWIPFVQVYMVGKMSDDINDKYNKKTHRGRWALIFTIAYMIFMLVTLVFIISVISNISSLISNISLSMDSGSLGMLSTDFNVEELSSAGLANIESFISGINTNLIIAALISGIVFIATTVISMIFQIMSWYSVYNEYNNKKASIYLVITIVVLLLTGSSILAPIFVLMLYKNTPQFEILNSSSSYQSVSGK